jgi:ABC-type dipeptide/oligopeptide/nickel transport systems, permease components
MRFLARRIVLMLFVLWGVTFITFFLSRVVPGDPARLIAGPRANAEALANIRALYGLDKPLVEQYVSYTVRLLHGDLGMSIVTKRPVTEDIGVFFPASLELAIYALILSTAIGLLLGVIGALRGGTTDRLVQMVAIACLSVPAFWVAMLFQLAFYSGLGLFPFGGRLPIGAEAPPNVTGLFTIDSLLAGNLTLFWTSLRHLVLPVVTLALALIGVMARITRGSMLQVLDEDYVRTARSKGLSRWRVLRRHSLRNALIAPVTVLGLNLGLLAGGVFLVETIFAWPGIGRYAFNSIANSDYNATMGVTLIIAVVYVGANLFVDLLYLLLDPRIRYA